MQARQKQVVCDEAEYLSLLHFALGGLQSFAHFADSAVQVVYLAFAYVRRFAGKEIAVITVKQKYTT